MSDNNNNNNNLITLPKNLWDEHNEKTMAQIRQICPATLTEQEFITFVGIGMATQLNPFLKEIWAVKFTPQAPAAIFIARDGYRKIAKRSADYEVHVADAVYQHDTFDVDAGVIKHSYSLKDRGRLTGAYCWIKLKSTDIKPYVYVEFNEYDKKQSLWLSKPATMIKKVAEAQALRMVFNELAGTYDESEQWDVVSEPVSKRRTIHAAVAPPPNDLDQDIYFITQCGSLEDLQIIFSDMTRRYKRANDLDAIQTIIAAKDKRKQELQPQDAEVQANA